MPPPSSGRTTLWAAEGHVRTSGPFAVAVCSAVIAGAVAACAAPGPPTPSPTPRTAVIGTFNAGGAGWAMAKAGNYLWIQVDPPVDAMVRINVATGAAEPMIPGGAKARSGRDGLWVACCDGVARIDPESGEQLLLVPMDGAYTVGDEGVWILTESEGLQRVDPQTGALGAGSGPFDGSVCREGWKDLVVAFGSGWLACKIGDVMRIDIETGMATVFPTGPGAHTFAVTDEAVWVTNYQAGGSVSRIDPVTNNVRTTPDAGSGIGITVGDGFIWASTGTGIAQIDPETGNILREFPIGSGWFYELVWDDGVIWASTTLNDVLKVDPYAVGTED